MTQQIPIDPDCVADAPAGPDGTHAVRPDLAYQRHVLVNVAYLGPPGAGDRGWCWSMPDRGLARRDRISGGGPFRDRRPSGRDRAHPRPFRPCRRAGGAGGGLGRAGLGAPARAALSRRQRRLSGPGSERRRRPRRPAVAAVSDPSRRCRRPLRLLPDDGSVPPLPGWRWIPTPGHSPGHVSLWRAADRTLIAGDAFVATAQESVYAVATQAPEMHGRRATSPPTGMRRRSVETLAWLEPELALTGHGRPLHGPGLRQALHALARDFAAWRCPKRGATSARRFVPATRTRPARPERVPSPFSTPRRPPAPTALRQLYRTDPVVLVHSMF